MTKPELSAQENAPQDAEPVHVEVRLPGGRFFVTHGGGIGIEHRGFVVVKPSLAHWIATERNQAAALGEEGE